MFQYAESRVSTIWCPQLLCTLRKNLIEDWISPRFSSYRTVNATCLDYKNLYFVLWEVISFWCENRTKDINNVMCEVTSHVWMEHNVVRKKHIWLTWYRHNRVFPFSHLPGNMGVIGRQVFIVHYTVHKCKHYSFGLCRKSVTLRYVSNRNARIVRPLSYRQLLFRVFCAAWETSRPVGQVSDNLNYTLFRKMVQCHASWEYFHWLCYMRVDWMLPWVPCRSVCACASVRACVVSGHHAALRYPARVIFVTEEVTDRCDVGRCKPYTSLGS